MSGEKQHNDHLLICIAGPTGVGKTELSLIIAGQYHTEIISADSRQLYKEMNIGTAKPSNEQLRQVRHHMVDCISINEDFSVGHYERLVIPLINQLHKKFQSIILTGGTGLYFKAIMNGLDTFPTISDNVKEEVTEMYTSKGLKGLQVQLKNLDADYYDQVDLGNPRRLMRALEVIMESGKPYSEFLSKSRSSRPFKTVPIFLNRKREELYDRINRNVIRMMESGLLDEAKKLYPLRQIPALQTVGYQELFDHFDGKISLDEAISLIQRNSRRYAKRQITWYRNQGAWIEFHPDEIEKIKACIDSYLK